jgi:hypothetical protein
MPVMIVILILIMKLVAVVVMTSVVMITADINDNYINIVCLLILELHNILCVSCVCLLLLTIQRRVLIIRPVFLSQVHLIIKKCHQNLLVKN